MSRVEYSQYIFFPLTHGRLLQMDPLPIIIYTRIKIMSCDMMLVGWDVGQGAKWDSDKGLCFYIYNP